MLKFTTTSMRRKVSGFTLVEVLVVVLVIGVIASAAGTYGYGAYKKSQLRKAAKDLYLAFKYARVAAVDNHQQCRVLIDKEQDSYLLVLGDEDQLENFEGGVSGQDEEGGVQVVSNPYSRPTELVDGIKFEEVEVLDMYADAEESFDQKEIVFRPDGSADVAVVQLSNGSSKFTVYLMPGTGRAKIEEGEIEELPMGVIDLDEQGIY